MAALTMYLDNSVLGGYFDSEFREAGFNRVNLENGYSAIRIISPLEIVYESQDEEI